MNFEGSHSCFFLQVFLPSDLERPRTAMGTFCYYLVCCGSLPLMGSVVTDGCLRAADPYCYCLSCRSSLSLMGSGLSMVDCSPQLHSFCVNFFLLAWRRPRTATGTYCHYLVRCCSLPRMGSVVTDGWLRAADPYCYCLSYCSSPSLMGSVSSMVGCAPQLWRAYVFPDNTFLIFVVVSHAWGLLSSWT